VNYANDEQGARDTVAVIEALGASAIAIQGDVSKPADVTHLFTASLERFVKIDIVVANAGVEQTDAPVVDFTEEQFDRLFAINTKGAFFTLQQAAKSVADNGRIIYIGSSTSAFPMVGQGLYGSSKMAAQFLVEVLAKEIGHRGVTVNTIIPTVIDGAGIFTHLEQDAPIRAFVKSYNPMGRMGTVEDVANVAEFFASDLSAFVSGQHLLISGGAPS
jgi:3-oxoacyl-[acyl-carrier protein] reductase